MIQKSHQSIVSEQFGHQANAYLASAVHAQGEDLLRLAKIIGTRPDALALDLGCGGGHVSFLLSSLLKRVTAYDLSQHMLETVSTEAARRGLENITTMQGAGETLPFNDASFDIVVSRYSLHHWDDAMAVLREARRVLRPGGLVVLIDVVSPDSALLDTWLQALELLRDPSHVRNYSIAELCAMLTAAGFQTGETSSFRLRLEFASWVKRISTPAIHVDAIRSLQSYAGAEVKNHFAIELDGTFTLDTAFIEASAQ